MKHADLFSDIEQNGTAIFRTRMPGWEDVWYVLSRPSRLRYVGVVNRRPLLPQPSRLNLNRRPTPLLRTIGEVFWFVGGTMDRSEITAVHPSYAALLGAELVTFVNQDLTKYSLGGANWTRSWQHSYQCGVVVPDDLELSPEELANPKLVEAKLKARHTGSGLLQAA